MALIVKADDVGLHMAANGRTSTTRRLGEAIVRGMPGFMKLLVIVGTAAMIWVGGSILVHALHEMGWHTPYDIIHDIAVSVAQASPVAQGAIEWGVTATLDGIIGLIAGLLLIPIITRVTAMFGGAESNGH